MNQRDLEKALEQEVERWPGVKVEFVPGGKHPKARYTFEGQMLSRPYPSTPGDSAFGIHNMLGDHRRVLKQLGAKRDKPEPSREEDEAPYRKPNEGKAKRPDPVAREPVEPKPDLADQAVAAGLATPERRDAIQAERSADTYRQRDSLTAYVERQMAVERAADDEDDDELSDEAERQARLEALILQVSEIRDGIYFGLDETVYHAVPRLSASGLQRLCVSPATFWRGSWLDPEAPDLDEGATPALILGKAYHCARLEPDRFHASYCRKPSKDDYRGQKIITSDTGVKAALKELGCQQTITSESTLERAQRLRDEGHEGPIWALIMDEHERERAGRVAIEAKFFDQIAADMERIRQHGEIAELLSGGEAEVSIFWTDSHGLPCKCRVDYLTPGWWDDFKTFDNSRGKILEQALADAVRYNRYYVQAVHYREGVEAVRTGGLEIVGEATDAQRALVAAIQIRPDELACWYIFQEKKGVPNLLAREFPFYDVPLAIEHGWSAGASAEGQARAEAATRRRTGIAARGEIEVVHAKDQFVLYSNAYKPGTPWFPLSAKARFSDLDFAPGWLEGKYQ
jgi:hypothetical protein